MFNSNYFDICYASKTVILLKDGWVVPKVKSITEVRSTLFLLLLMLIILTKKIPSLVGQIVKANGNVSDKTTKTHV